MSHIAIESRQDLRTVQISFSDIPLNGDVLQPIWGNIEGDPATAFVMLSLNHLKLDTFIKDLQQAASMIEPKNHKSRINL